MDVRQSVASLPCRLTIICYSPLVATLAACSERSVRAAISRWEELVAKGKDPVLPKPDLEWGPEKTPLWIVGRPPTDKERKTARRSRHDPDPDPALRRLWEWEGEFVAGFGLTDESAMILAGGLEELLRYYEACGHGDGHPGGIERGCEACLEAATIKRFLST